MDFFVLICKMFHLTFFFTKNTFVDYLKTIYLFQNPSLSGLTCCLYTLYCEQHPAVCSLCFFSLIVSEIIHFSIVMDVCHHPEILWPSPALFLTHNCLVSHCALAVFEIILALPKTHAPPPPPRRFMYLTETFCT